MAIDETPQEGIDNYDSGMSSNQEINNFLNSIKEGQKDYNRAIDMFGAQKTAQETNALQQQQMGLISSGRGVDPVGSDFAPQDLFTIGGGIIGGGFGGPGGMVLGTGIGSGLAELTGSDSKFQQSLKSGTGMLIESTGDTYEFLKAVVTPWDPDIDQNTTIGDFLQRYGSDMALSNSVYMPDNLKTTGWGQLADPTFWATDVAKLLPYSMSFFLPAGLAARSTRFLLNSTKVYKGAKTLGVGEKLYKPVITKASKKQAKRQGIQQGEEFAKMEMRKGIDIVTSSVGGGIGGNYAEGAYVAGEAMQDALAAGLSDQEAQAVATQVWRDNTNWVAADIAQFGLVFGGFGRLTRGFRGLLKPTSFGQKVLPFMQAGTTAAAEGYAEQHQEVYQEWIKHRALAEKGGGEPLTYSEYFKQMVAGTSVGDALGYGDESEFRKYYKSEKMLQTRVTAFALGGAMGARGGYVDAIAERDYQMQEQRQRLGDLMDLGEFEQAQQMRQNIIAHTVIDSNGDASLAKSRVERMVAEKQMREEKGKQLIEAIEQAEDIYDSTFKGNQLTQAGKRQIFLTRVEIAEQNAAIERLQETRDQEIEVANNNFKNNEAKRSQAINEANQNFEEAKSIIEEEIKENELLIENIASVKLGKLTKDQTRVKRTSKGLRPEEFTEFTTEGRQAEQDKPGLVQRAATAIKGGAQAVAKGVGKAVQTVKERGVRQAAQDAIQSAPAKKATDFLKTQIDKGTNFVKKYADKVIPGASARIEEEVKKYRETLGEKTPTAEELKSKAKEIVDKIKKTDLKGATTEVINEVKDFVERKLKDQSVTETLAEVYNAAKTKGKSLIDRAKAAIDKKTEELNQRREQVREQDIETGRKVDAQTATTEEVAEKKPKKKSKKTVKQEAKKKPAKETSDTESKFTVQDFINQAKNKFTFRKDTDQKKAPPVFKTRINEQDMLIRGYLRAALQEKFPGVNVEFTNRQVIEGFGAPASAVFFSSTILVNPEAAMQTDLIHELSHPYYQSIAGTPLQKRLNTLLIKRRIVTPNGSLVRLLDNIQYNYPLLTRYRMNGRIMTGGDIITDLLENRRRDVDSALGSLLDNVVESAAAGDTIQYKNSVQSLFAQMSEQGSIKRLTDQTQYGLLEEAFAYTNEDFNRQGGIQNVIENKSEANRYESILKRLYKRVSGLAKEEEAKAAMEQQFPEVREMNFEEMMRYIQQNFNTLNVDNQLKQNSYSKQTMLKQAKFDAVSTKGLFRIIQQQVASKGKKGEDAVQDILQEIYKQNYKTYNRTTQQPPQGVDSIQHDYLVRKVRSQVDRVSFQEYERVVNNLVESVNNRLNQGQRSDDSLEFSLNLESEIAAEENDKGNIYDQEERLFGDTTSKLLQAYAIEESKKDDKNPVNLKNLLAELHDIGQKTKKQDTFTFVTNVTNSSNPDVVRFVKFINSKFKKQSLADALLLEMSLDFANKQIETMKEVGFRRGDNGLTTWVPGVSFSTDEVRWQNNMTQQANSRWFAPAQGDILETDRLKNKIAEVEDIAGVLTALYGDSNYWQFIDKRKLAPGNVYNYKNKRYNSLETLVLQNKKDFLSRNKLQLFNGFDNLLADLIVQSRAKNYITQVNDVAENPTLTINKENSIHNKNENYADLAGKDIFAYVELMKDLGFFGEQSGFTNIYAEMLADGTGKEHNISMLSGVFSVAKYAKQDKRRNRKYVKMDSQELMLTDFNDFLYSLSRYSSGVTAYYDQPIAVFGAAKRRYYIKTPIANTLQQRQDLLEMAYNAGYNTAKYDDGSRVNPFKIVKKKDGYALVGLKEYKKKFKQQILKDEKQIQLNDLIGSKGKNLKDADIDNYILNYSINKFMAQEMFIGKHEQSDNEIDYIKRAEGSIKRHIPHDRNTPIEFVAFQDVIDFDGEKATDAQAYVLPGDGEIIRKKFGSMRQTGHQFKHVYDYVETDNPNAKMFGKRTFAKFKIDEITPEMEKNSPYRKKIANILRARKEAIGASKLIPGPEITGRNHDFIPIATFESALKVYAPGKDYMYDLENTTEEDIVNRQNDIYNAKGEAEADLLDSWQGLSGEGFGLQVELDKERHSFHMPSQLFGHHHTNLEPGEEAMVKRMHELAAQSMVGFEQERSGSVIYSDESTPEQREKDVQFLSKLIGEEFFGNLNTSLAQYAPGLHPQLHSMMQQLAASRLVKFGTKAMFGGTIAYQTSPIGRDLKSYIKISDLIDQSTNQQYINALNSRIEEGKDFVVSEAIIPATAKQDGVKVGDLVLGTRIPAHGKQSSVVFVVKGFAQEGTEGARSTIEIPSKVSAVMGADLDGDAIYINYKHYGNVPGTTRTSPLGTEARIQTNLLKDYQVSANELLDLNLKLLGDIEIDSRRYKEITTPIEIKEIAEGAISAVESFYGEKLVMDNQLTPTGDSQYFNDNVPAQNMIGTIASLQRILNVMAGHKVGFTFGLKINNYDEISSLVDRFDQNKPEGDAFTVAQLLNIVLDNAKYQYANKLGLTPNTVNIFTLLARTGIDIKDVAVIMNHPIVKLYDKHRGDQSIMTTSNTNQALVNAYAEYYANVGKKEAKKKIDSFRRSGDIQLNTQQLKGKNKNAELALFDMLFKLEKTTDQIFSIGKALSVHKSVPQFGHDAQNLINTITQDVDGSFLNPNSLGNFRSDPLVKHSLNLLQKQVDRQKSTSFMYTPEARQVIEYIEDTRNIKFDFSRYEHKRLLEDYYLMKVSEAVPSLNINNKTLQDVYNTLEAHSKLPGDNFVKKYLLFSNIEQQDDFYKTNIQINPNEINKFSVEETIQIARNEFTTLPDNIKDALLQFDYIKNGLGFKGKTLTSLFAQNYVREKFGLLDELLQKEISNTPSIDDPAVVDKANELMLNHPNLFRDEEKTTTTQKEVQRLKGQETFEPSGTAKLKLNRREFYQDHLQELTKTLTYNEYLKFLGYSPDAVTNAEPKVKRYLEDRYKRYLDSLANVETLENQLEDMDSMSIKELVKIAGDLQNREDELASPKLLHKLHLAIGKKAMRIQSQKIADKTGETFEAGQEDISAIRKWFGSNNMTSDRPEIQFMLNEIEKEYRKYVREVKSLVQEIDTVHRALRRSKGFSLKGLYDPRARHQELFGKMFTEDIKNGRLNGIRLVDRATFNASNPSQEERDFYNKYMEITARFRSVLGKDGMGKFYIPHVLMGNLEALSARGLLGLYANYLGSTNNIDNVRVYGTSPNGKRALQSFGYWKDLYLTEGGELTMPSGRRIKELNKLKKKAEAQSKLGVHEDGDAIVATDLEMDTLMEGGLFSRFNASRTVRAKELTSYNLTENLKQYVRSVSFVHGYGEFKGMNDIATLVDAVIAINNDMGNKNAAEYVTKVFRQGFLRKQRQESMFGKNFDKATQFLVRWTALVHLGFSAAVGVGNILAGKYQELRAKGGKKFMLGERRFWTSYTKDGWKGMDILKKYRIVELSFSDVVGAKDAFSQIESWAFLPMELSERWIQGAAFLGELTQEEFDTGEVSEQRVMEINSRIATMHGEGYTQLDQRLLSMYSLGVAAQQFKRWFITLAYNRLKQEDINRFGEKEIGSYRAGYDFVKKMFEGEVDMLKLKQEFEALPEFRQNAILALLRGFGLTAMLLLLGGLSDDDEIYSDSIRKLSNDALIFTDTKRFVNYTIPPASISTGRNALQFSKELVTLERYQRDSKFGDRGDLKAKGTLRKVLPFKAVTEPLLER